MVTIEYLTELLIQIGDSAMRLLDYDSVSISDDKSTLCIGFLNNPRPTIILDIKKKTDNNYISLRFNEKTKPDEVIKFWFTIGEKIPAEVIVNPSFK